MKNQDPHPIEVGLCLVWMALELLLPVLVALVALVLLVCGYKPTKNRQTTRPTVQLIKATTKPRTDATPVQTTRPKRPARRKAQGLQPQAA